MMAWQDDMNFSNIAFEKNKATFESLLEQVSGRKGKLISCEVSHDLPLFYLDRKAGIDYLWIDAVGIRGVATRCQWGTNYKTFTIRKERTTGETTEMVKRLDSFAKGGYLYPHWTIQSYLDNRKDNTLLCCGVIETKSLFDYVNLLKTELAEQRAFDGNVFIVVPFDVLAAEGSMTTYVNQDVKW
jgi:hypothetical protein